MLHQIQKMLHERTRFAPIYDFFWPSGIGPRVEEASLMKIGPFPWSAPLEDVRLKRSICYSLVGSLVGSTRSTVRGRRIMTRIAPHVIAALAFGLSACTNPYDPVQRG